MKKEYFFSGGIIDYIKYLFSKYILRENSTWCIIEKRPRIWKNERNENNKEIILERNKLTLEDFWKNNK